ncbi:hypothetical protein C8R43DRAFT_1109862 [Mycena crocata]|nr:hypothetical protein C8R43DRAFT_1109862 [Mycena crocata]
MSSETETPAAGSFEKSDLIPDSTQLRHLRDLIRSNTFPADPETSSHFRNVIDNSPGELARYTTEIERLQKILTGLKEDRATLAEYAAGCSSIFSPARRIPTELLVEIFDMTSPFDPESNFFDEIPELEVERLAKTYLLDISQVCSYWHSAAMGTPRLWADLSVDVTLWTESDMTQFDLVATSLQRSANCPLTMGIVVVDGGISRQLIELLVRHSHRWKDVCLWMDPRSFEFLAAARGHLPILQRLDISGVTDETFLGFRFDAFELAPKLTKFGLRFWSSDLPVLPWGQLTKIRYDNEGSPNLSNGFELMRSLQTASVYHLHANVSCISLPVTLLPVASNIAGPLTIEITPSADPAEAQGVLTAILDALTLSSLRHILLFSKPGAPPLLWAQTPDFMAFASRSSLHASLTVLEIKVVILDGEFLQCLSVLPSLETLSIHDCEDIDGGHAVITDNLLRRLTWVPDEDNLIPRLNYLKIFSLLRFQDDLFWEFIVSRILPGRCTYGPFETDIFWLLGSDRQFSSEFTNRLVSLKKKGDLYLVIGPAAEA